MATRLRSYKRDSDYTYTLGVFPTLELLQHRPEQVTRVVLSSAAGSNSGAAEIERICTAQGIPISVSSRSVNRLGGNENTYAIGVFDKYSAPPATQANHVVLVNPSDAGNVGTIVRTMLGFDLLDLIIVRPAVDLFAPKTIRASMGALFQLRFAYVSTFEEYAQQYPRHYYPFMTNAQHTLEDTRARTPFTLVFGGEGAGLDPKYRDIGTGVRIPQGERVDSYNLAVSVGIGLYWATREANQGTKI